AGTRSRRVFLGGRRSAQLAEDPAAPPVADCPVGGPQLDEELFVRKRRRFTGVNQLVRLDVTALIEENALEDAAAQRWQRLRDNREPAPTVAVAEPVDREITDDGDKPSGEA